MIVLSDIIGSEMIAVADAAIGNILVVQQEMLSRVAALHCQL